MAYSRAVSSWFERRRGVALALVMSGGAIGGMVLPPGAEAETGSYEGLLVRLALGTLTVAALMPCLPGFDAPRAAAHQRVLDSPPV
jgi:hypothetical protein